MIVKFQGSIADAKTIASVQLNSEINNIADIIYIEANRSKAELISKDIEEDDILCLEFEDGIEWIGAYQDIHEIFGPEASEGIRGGGDIFPTSIQSSEDDRGFLKNIFIKVVQIIKGEIKDKAKKKLTETAREILGKKIIKKADEAKVSLPGLYKVNTNAGLSEIKLPPKSKESYLLFIHGTFSNFKGSFEELFKDEQINTLLHEQYTDKILALEHHTLGLSPFQNAIDALTSLPQGVTLDIISHSRGGLIADILTSCERTEDVYPASIINKVKLDDDTGLADLLLEINKLAKEKKLKINKVIRVAAPANGTILLSKRLDHYLNALLMAIGHYVGGKLNPIYGQLKGFITDIIKTRLNPELMPGLVAMVPDSTPQTVLNRKDIIGTGKLYVIEGNTEIGKNIARSCWTILSNLYYWKANDFVVNTDSMRSGLQRASGMFVFRSEDNDTSHFRYFLNKNSREAILHALVYETSNLYSFISSSDADDRGIIIQHFYKFSKVSRTLPFTGNKPILILVPGIMGTHLSVNNNTIWLDLGEVGKGNIVNMLDASNNNVGHDEIIGNFYEKIIKYFEDQGYEVRTFGYDWRLSLKIAADKFINVLQDALKKNQPVSVIAHSMGGLVVRDTMRYHPTLWSKYSALTSSRIILLGTPWKGAHETLSVFTGHFKRLILLARLDTHHPRKKLMEIFSEFPGIYELLPINEEPIENISFWNKIAKVNKRFVIPSPAMLVHFTNYKTAVKKFNPDLTNLFYVAGKGEETINGLTIQNSTFGERVIYLDTAEGDGTVTWELGIPNQLPPTQLYYADTSHGELANDEKNFKALLDLVTVGNTRDLSTTAPVVSDRSIRSFTTAGNKVLRAHEVKEESPNNGPEDIMRGLLGFPDKKSEWKQAASANIKVRVKVSHCDLKFSDHPLLLGHFMYDGISHAEAALDYHFGGKLSQRHNLISYPGRVGDSLILFDPDNQPKGAIIVGLGEQEKFTPYFLRKTIEAAVINYFFHLRDNTSNNSEADTKPHRNSISSLCIGSGYGRLSIEDSLLAILTGISQANEYIYTQNRDYCIHEIEVIELYDHIAQNVYFQLKQLEKLQNNFNKINFSLHPKIEHKEGARKKIQYSSETQWWHHLTTRQIEKDDKKIPYLQYTSSSGIARVEEENIFSNKQLIESLLDTMAESKIWDKKYSKTLFEILVPNQFKDILRNQNNILWKLDRHTAALPWEMFHDYEYDAKPTFVQAGLIRQLYTPDVVSNLRMIHNNNALVVGDPIYEDNNFAQLNGAKEEAESVIKLLKSNNFNVIPLVQKYGIEIINELYNNEYRILHIAGHGDVTDDPNETGVILDKGKRITTSMIKNFSRIPELVFVNCCWSGAMDTKKEGLYKKRYKFAANIGTQLIEIGVKAVVVAGWPVNDGAAKLFAETFYKALLLGYTFGDAVKKARYDCYSFYGQGNNTWAAYQCYGDPFYKLISKSASGSPVYDFFVKEQVLTELYNLESEIRLGDKSSPNQLENKLSQIIDGAKRANLYEATVIESHGNVLNTLGKQEDAIDRYETLRTLEEADYSVKSLEQFINLMVKNFANKVGNKKITDPKKVVQIKEKADIIQKYLKNLILLGKTHERLNILASGYKRLGYVMNKLNHKEADIWAVENFTLAADTYLQAYHLIPEDKIRESIYSLSNFLPLHRISGNKKIMIRNKSYSVDDYFKKIKPLVKQLPALRKGFWLDITYPNILTAELFYLPASKLASQSNTILDEFTKIYKLTGKPKNLNSEIEHIVALIDLVDYISTSKEWKDKMKNVLKKLEMGYKSLRV